MWTNIPTNEKVEILRAVERWLLQVTTQPASISIIINVSCILEQLVKLAKIPSSH
jgi:hypothetical protein